MAPIPPASWTSPPSFPVAAAETNSSERIRFDFPDALGPMSTFRAPGSHWTCFSDLKPFTSSFRIFIERKYSQHSGQSRSFSRACRMVRHRPPGFDEEAVHGFAIGALSEYRPGQGPFEIGVQFLASTLPRSRL